MVQVGEKTSVLGDHSSKQCSLHSKEPNMGKKTCSRPTLLFLSPFPTFRYPGCFKNISTINYACSQRKHSIRYQPLQLRMGSDNLKFWKDLWSGGFPGGETYLKEVIESDFQKPVPGLDDVVASKTSKASQNTSKSQVYSSSAQYNGPSGNSVAPENKNSNISGAQVRLVTDPVTGRSRLEVVSDES
eukprot:jgi/Galph1/2427/GphlegSOOS_G1105.1